VQLAKNEVVTKKGYQHHRLHAVRFGEVCTLFRRFKMRHFHNCDYGRNTASSVASIQPALESGARAGEEHEHKFCPSDRPILENSYKQERGSLTFRSWKEREQKIWADAKHACASVQLPILDFRHFWKAVTRISVAIERSASPGSQSLGATSDSSP
jgi:hypothetical protein